VIFIGQLSLQLQPPGVFWDMASGCVHAFRLDGTGAEKGPRPKTWPHSGIDCGYCTVTVTVVAEGLDTVPDPVGVSVTV
jgi:hypothetical protein